MSQPLRGEHHGNEASAQPQTDTLGAPAQLCETPLPGADKRWGEVFKKQLHFDIWVKFQAFLPDLFEGLLQASLFGD